MNDKLKSIFAAIDIEALKSRIKEFLKQPATKEDMLLFEDIPMIKVQPTSINEKKKEEKVEKRPNAIPIFSNPAYKKEPKLVGDGGRIE